MTHVTCRQQSCTCGHLQETVLNVCCVYEGRAPAQKTSLEAANPKAKLWSDVHLLLGDPNHSQLETVPIMICIAYVPCDMIAPALHKRLNSTHGRCLEVVRRFAAQCRIVVRAVVVYAVMQTDTRRHHP